MHGQDGKSEDGSFESQDLCHTVLSRVHESLWLAEIQCDAALNNNILFQHLVLVLNCYLAWICTRTGLVEPILVLQFFVKDTVATKIYAWQAK